MATDVTDNRINLFGRSIYFGWVIVAVCTLTMGVAYGVMYSFSVFFKPIAAHFQWSRSTVSSIYALALIFRGTVSIGIGWLADRYGPIKLTALCGLLTGIGLILVSRVGELWQFYIAYGVITATGLSGAFTIGSAVTARWFTKGRGLALGFMAAGSGMGTLLIVPTAEYLIGLFDWSTVFLLFGIGSGLIITGTAFALKPSPTGQVRLSTGSQKPARILEAGKSLKEALFSREMPLLIIIFSAFIFCLQMVMIHLVNYATDIGIDGMHAAGYISLIGVVSIGGRLLMGSISDRIGSHHSLTICSLLLMVSMAWLIFAAGPLKFWVFAIVFGFAYGGQIPLIPIFICEIFGTRAMASLIGVLLFIGTMGGGLGAWIGGKVHDSTHSYLPAFAVALAAGFVTLTFGLILKHMNRKPRACVEVPTGDLP
jgi:OFA family oxalate/formate antiporter-like MFS transporter